MVMAFQGQDGWRGGIGVSPGGFEFGLQGWMWPDPVPRAVTFFLDGSALVSDQFGRPIKGAEVDGRQYYFATCAPAGDRDEVSPYQRRTVEVNRKQVPLATHAEVVACLEAERVDWIKLTHAGTPQLPYEQLKRVPDLPPVEEAQLRRIPDAELRRAALRVRREVMESRAKEMQAAEVE